MRGGEVKERPILFSAPMVCAILSGAKTQTRRMLKKQPNNPYPTKDEGIWGDTNDPVTRYFACPHGQPGDRLYVRETFAVIDREGFANEKPDSVIYACDPSTSPHLHFRPSIHMHRWASRITLEIVSVKVERLNDISDSDALAEGVTIQQDAKITSHYLKGEHTPAQLEYFALWESINGKNSWNLNPFVWVVCFKKL